MLRLLLIVTVAASALAADGDQRLRAAASGPELIYRLTRFIAWPPMGVAPFVVGIAGVDSDEAPLRVWMEGRTMLGRVVVFRHVTTAEEMRTCQLVFLGRSMEPQIRGILLELEGSGVLTVAGIPGFGQMGGMVELLAEPRRRSLALNAEAARRAGFQFQAGLLTVATIARTGRSTE